jgi:hypothetical protein
MMHTTDTPPVPPGTSATTDRPGSPEPRDSAAKSTEHDGRGRFAKGNKGGPGNPYARQVAKLRQAMLAVVKPEDIQAIIVRMILAAQTGDVAAAKLALAYTLGKPGETVNPDTLDEQEWELAQQRLAFHPTLPGVLSAVPMGLACELASTIVPGIETSMAQTFSKAFKEADAAEQAQPVPPAQPAPEPAPVARASAPEQSTKSNGATRQGKRKEKTGESNVHRGGLDDLGGVKLEQWLEFFRQIAPQPLPDVGMPGEGEEQGQWDPQTGEGMANLLNEGESLGEGAPIANGSNGPECEGNHTRT